LPMPDWNEALPVTTRLPALAMLPVAVVTVRLPVAEEAVLAEPSTKVELPRTDSDTFFALKTTPPVVKTSVVASPTEMFPFAATSVTVPEPRKPLMDLASRRQIRC